MPIRWTQTALDARIQSLEERHEGQALIDAVVSFADTLAEEDRRTLQDVLLDRAKQDRLAGMESRHWADVLESRFPRRRSGR